jgi:hypothetical protein
MYRYGRKAADTDIRAGRSTGRFDVCYKSAVSDVDVVLRRGPQVWVVEALAIVVLALLVAATVNLWVGVAVAVVGLAILHRPVAVAVRPAGIILRTGRWQTGPRRGIPWSDINAIRVTTGWRAKSVEVFRVSRQAWLPVPGVVTSRTLPSRRFDRNLAGLTELAGVPVTTRHWGPAWIWPVALAFAVMVPLVTQDPVHNWLPRPEANGVPGQCDLSPATADSLGVAETATTVDSPLVWAAKACARTGDHRVLITAVERYGRTGVRNALGTAKHIYTEWRVDFHGSPTSDPPPEPGPLPADEVSSSGFAPDDRSPVQGVYLVARKANVVVFIAYSPDHDTVVPLLARNPYADHYQPWAYRLNARPEDLAVATRVANELLGGITVDA